MKTELKYAACLMGIFLVAYFLPLSNAAVSGAILEAFKLLQWYVRNHTLACVVPALFIAGGIITFLSEATVMRYLGPKSNKPIAYGVAAVSGAVLAVCSCSVLPMFVGIYQLGAGLGPASAFLYSGPAINVLAIFLTARVLGFEIGVWRAVGSIVFAVVIGLLMALIFRREENHREREGMLLPEPEAPTRPLWKNAVFLGCMVGFLVFSDWFNPGDVVVRTREGTSFAAVTLHEMKDEVMFQLKEPWQGQPAGAKVTLPKTSLAQVEEAKTWVMAIYHARWYLAGAMGLAVLWMTWRWLTREEFKTWMTNTWNFSKLLVPLLFGGVFVVGFIGPLVPEKVVASLVGDNSLRSNFIASIIGPCSYMATLTEIPICEALGKLGMAPGPMLALLLAGPVLSLPSILVLGRVIGFKKTAVFMSLTVVMATITGMIFGSLQ